MTEQGGFDPAYFPLLAQAEDRSFWFRSRNALILWAIRRYARAGWAEYLEVGCGTGFVLRAVAEAYPSVRITGTELFGEALGYAQDRVPTARLLQMDARNTPFRDAFDVVGAFDVLEHIDDDWAVLGGLRDALRPDGILVVTVPQHRWLWSRQDETAGHVRRYSAQELHDRVRDAGLKVLKSTSFVSLLLPLLAASRLVARREVTDDLRQRRLLDGLLGRVMWVERKAIESGVVWPWGGSRLVVAARTR